MKNYVISVSEIYSPQQVASNLDVSMETVNGWLADGLPTMNIIPERTLVFGRDLVDFLLKKSQPKQSLTESLNAGMW